MPDQAPFDDGSPEADEALRRYHADLERSAAPDPAFRHELLGELEQPVRRRGPSNAVLGAIGLAAGLAGVAVLGVTLAFLRPDPTPDRAATSTPDATEVAIATDAPTERPLATPLPTASAAATPTPSPVPTTAPTPSPAPTASAAPTAPPTTPTATLAPTARPTAQPTPPLVAGAWTTTAPIPFLPPWGRGGLADVAPGSDGRLYALTWGVESSDERFYAYDAARDRWTELAAPNDIVAAASFLIGGSDGRVYHFAGGASETRLWAYDPSTDEWGERRSIPVDMMFDAVVGPDGRVLYIHDGSYALRTRTEVAALDLQTLEIEVLAGIDGRYGRSVEMGADGRMYTIEGGIASYDPRTDTWREERQAQSVDEFTDFAAGADGRLYLQMGSSGVQLLAWERSGSWLNVEPGPDEPLAPDLVTGSDGRLYAIESVGGGTGAGAVFEAEGR